MEKQNEMLFEYAAENNAQGLQALLDKANIDINAKNEMGQTPLMVACQNGCMNTSLSFIKHPQIDINATDGPPNYLTALQYAAQNSHNNIVDILFSCFNLESKDISYALLHYARIGNKEKVEECLKRGADINFDYLHDTPLSVAIIEGHEEIINLLLEQKNIDVDIPNYLNETPLLLAIKYQKLNLVQRLLQYENIDLHRQSFLYSTFLTASIWFKFEEANQLLLAKEEKFENKWHPGAFNLAIRHKNIELVKTLIEKGATVTGSDEQYYQEPPDWVWTGEVENEDAVPFYPYHRPPKVLFDIPIIEAIKSGDIEIVKLLLIKGANSSEKNTWDMDAKKVIEFYKIGGAIKELILNSAKVDTKLHPREEIKETTITFEEGAPLSSPININYASSEVLLPSEDKKMKLEALPLELLIIIVDFACNSLSEYVKFAQISKIFKKATSFHFLQEKEKRLKIYLETLDINNINLPLFTLHSADSFLKTLNGLLPLVAAASIGSRKCIQLLLKKKADIENQQPVKNGQGGETAFLQAVKSNHFDAVCELIEKGANFFAQNAEGNTALHLAALNHDIKLLRLLIGYEKKLSSLKLTNNIYNHDGHLPITLAQLNNFSEGVGLLGEYAKYCQALSIEHHKKLQRESTSKVIESWKLQHITYEFNIRTWTKAINSQNLLQIKAYLDNPYAVQGLLDIESSSQQNALHKAVLTGNEKILELMLKFLINIDGIILFNNSSIDIKAHLKGLFKQQDREGNTLLHLAVRHENLNLIQLLFATEEAHTFINMKNKQGLRPLDIVIKAQKNNPTRQNQAILKFLQTASPKGPNLKLNFNKIPFKYLIYMNYSVFPEWTVVPLNNLINTFRLTEFPPTLTVSFLTELTDFINIGISAPLEEIKNFIAELKNTQLNLFRYAAINEIVLNKTLIEVSFRDLVAEISLRAIYHFYKTISKQESFKLPHNKEQEKRAKFCIELFHLAARRNDPLVIELLKNYQRIDVNSQGRRTQRTALHWAVIERHSSMIKLLIKMGARFDIGDKEGKTVLDYADDKVRNLLLKTSPKEAQPAALLLEQEKLPSLSYS